jgi:hypothetical protein
MLAERSIYLWRDWLIRALNRDLPYDQFVRAHIAGDLSPRADDFFATAFLTRAVRNANDPNEDLATEATEKVSSAFMAMTTACAKCHDHMYDPILQRDYYAMKALFDPLVPDKRNLATPDEIVRHEELLAKSRAAQAAIQQRVDAIAKPYEQKIIDERVAFLPPDAQAAYRKPAAERTEADRKLVAQYAAVVDPDPRALRDTLPLDKTVLYEWTRSAGVQIRRDTPVLPHFWTVRADAARAARPSHIYVGGDRAKKGVEVQPGFPFAPKDLAFSGDRRQPFLNWLTAPENPFFARVAVNRLWQWHFGDGIVTTPELLDLLASEFVAKKYSMKAMHKLIVMSETYQRSSAATPELRSANEPVDSANKHLWKYPVRRLEAEIIRDSMLAAAGTLDLSIGGVSFRGEGINERRVMSAARTGNYDKRSNRRGIYMGRGSDASMNMMPAFLTTFDAEDGHIPCARRERTVTAPQVLYLLNGSLPQEASRDLAARLYREGGPRPVDKVNYGFKLALGRPPSPAERDAALSYLKTAQPAELNGFAWMLLNLSEFVFLP